jgi:hypothetical protein
VTTATLFEPEVGAAASLFDRIRELEENPPTPDNAELLGLLMAGALQQAMGLELAWKMCIREGEVWEIEWYARRLRVLAELSTIVADIIDRTQKMLARLQRENPAWVLLTFQTATIESKAATVADIAAKVRETLTWLERPQPPLNEEMIMRSRESLARGEGEEISEMIARFENGGPLVKE